MVGVLILFFVFDARNLHKKRPNVNGITLHLLGSRDSENFESVRKDYLCCQT
jgi:hypothetical protein